MAEGQIKKGFFFYFGLFVLLLVTVFLILMVIMMFNPGKSIAWMQYFTGNGKYVQLETTTDTKENIDWHNVTDVKIECGYANITVEKNNNNNMAKDGIYISNNTKGFQVSNGAVNFSYSVVFANGNKNAVNIVVTEPNGFLYFSKNIDIVVHYDDTSSFNFGNKNFTFITTSGNINLGGTSTQWAQNIAIKSVKATTENGTISISKYFDSASTQVNGDYVFETNNGTILSTKTIQIAGGEGNGFDFANASSLKINVMGKGKIDLPIIRYAGKTLDLICRRGIIDVNYIEAANINVEGIEGNHLYGTVKGNLSYNNSLDNILSPNITITKVEGNFSLSGIKDNSTPRIKIGEITGNIHVNTKNGSIEVEKVNQNVSITGTGLAVSLEFIENFNSSVDINTNAGVSLKFNGQVPNGANIKAAGDVSVNVTNTASFIAQIYNFDADKSNPSDEDKIPVERIYSNIGTSVKNAGEFRIGSSGNRIRIFTNASVSFNLVEKTVA